jgi:hypothetical protein
LLRVILSRVWLGNNKNIGKRTAFVFVLAVFFVFFSGCAKPAGGRYNKSCQLPSETKDMEFIGAGFTSAFREYLNESYDWVSFKDESGTIYIYRQDVKGDTWYKTVIHR